MKARKALSNIINPHPSCLGFAWKRQEHWWQRFGQEPDKVPNGYSPRAQCQYGIVTCFLWYLTTIPPEASYNSGLQGSLRSYPHLLETSWSSKSITVPGAYLGKEKTAVLSVTSAKTADVAELFSLRAQSSSVVMPDGSDGKDGKDGYFEFLFLRAREALHCAIARTQS